jgi:uncharacterized protein YggE
MKKTYLLLLGTLLFFFPACLVLGEDFGNVSRIVVQGEGKVNAAPDMAIVTFGVETRDLCASAAAEENARLMNATISALLAADIKEKDIQTSHYRLTTRTEHIPCCPPDCQPGQRGCPLECGDCSKPQPPEFEATNQVTVKLNDTSALGRVMDASVSAGSNRILGFSFDLKDDTNEKNQALTMAIRDARQKAEVAAMAANVKLGRVLELSEGYSSVRHAARAPNMARAMGGRGQEVTPVEPGEMEVTSSVTVTYEIF